MKKLLLLAAIALISVMSAVGQESHTKVERQGNQYIETATQQRTQSGKSTPYTYTTKEGVEYQIYILDNGRCYIMASRKYLDEATCKDICNQLGVEYTYVKKEKAKKQK